MANAVVFIAEDEFMLSREQAFVFGRSDAEGVRGLDANDMGISSEAGSVEYHSGRWWVVNRSRKRPLLLDCGGGGPLRRLACGHKDAVSQSRVSVLVPGAIFTHLIELMVTAEDLATSADRQ